MALKFIPKVGKSEAELRGLEQEMAIMYQLRHDNIIALHDCLETQDEVAMSLIKIACLFNTRYGNLVVMIAFYCDL